MIAGPVLEVVRSNLCEATKPARAKDEERERKHLLFVYCVVVLVYYIFER